MTKKKRPATQSIVQQGAKFGLVGVSNTVIDYTIFISFYWNRRWVFRSRTDVGTSGVKFLVATLVSIWLIQPFMVHTFTTATWGVAFGTFWYEVARTLHITTLLPHTVTHAWAIKTVAFGMGVVGSAIWNFTMYKLWAFREK
jgi:putative flippase GtrA